MSDIFKSVDDFEFSEIRKLNEQKKESPKPISQVVSDEDMNRINAQVKQIEKETWAMSTEEEISALKQENERLKLIIENKELSKGEIPLSMKAKDAMKYGVWTVAGLVAGWLAHC